jgi:hypothetical protein
MRNRPVTQVDVEQAIHEYGEDLEKATEAYESQVVKAANAEVAYKVAYAKRYLRQRGTVAEREAMTISLLEWELTAYKREEALVKAFKERLLTLRAHLDWLRSLNANVRAQT